jgi:hypothetical protein
MTITKRRDQKEVSKRKTFPGHNQTRTRSLEYQIGSGSAAALTVLLTVSDKILVVPVVLWKTIGLYQQDHHFWVIRKLYIVCCITTSRLLFGDLGTDWCDGQRVSSSVPMGLVEPFN